MRALLFDLQGRLLAKCQQSLDDYVSLHEGWLEHDAEAFWQAAAGVCRGLPGKMAQQLFVQLYPQPDCSKMHARFLATASDAEGRRARGGTGGSRGGLDHGNPAARKKKDERP